MVSLVISVLIAGSQLRQFVVFPEAAVTVVMKISVLCSDMEWGKKYPASAWVGPRAGTPMSWELMTSADDKIMPSPSPQSLPWCARV
jgi:hypothetical protein